MQSTATSFSLKCGLHISVEKVLEGHNITVTRTQFHNPLGGVDIEEFISKYNRIITEIEYGNKN